MQDQQNAKLDEIAITPPLSRRESVVRHNMSERDKALIKSHMSKQTLIECMSTLDIFKDIMQDSKQQPKLLRDVKKNLKMQVYYEGDIIYEKGDIASCFYMIVKGEVALCLPVLHQNKSQQQNSTDQASAYEYHEVDTFQEGMGFGEGEFVQKKKRALEAKVKQDQTLIAIINGAAFQEIIESYKQRIYYKKIEMFGRSPLLKKLQAYQLEFIVNNAKPIVFPISKTIIHQGQRPKVLYLLTEGQVQLRQEQRLPQIKKKFYKLRTDSNENSPISNRYMMKQALMGIKQAGSFIGDCEMALDASYNMDYVCKSEKVKAYACDQRIIMSQMTEQILQQARSYYQQKMAYRKHKLNNQKQARIHLQKLIQNSQEVTLSPNQLKIKRKINNRYVQQRPSFIGKFSPREISKMVDRKFARIKSQPPVRQTNSLPKINMLQPLQKKRKILVSPSKKTDIANLVRSNSLVSEQSQGAKYHGASVAYSYSSLHDQEQVILHSETRPLLVYMRPFHKKVESLHERLSKEYRNIRKKSQVIQKSPQFEEYSELSLVEMRRIYEFVAKLKTSKKRKKMSHFSQVQI